MRLLEWPRIWTEYTFAFQALAIHTPLNGQKINIFDNYLTSNSGWTAQNGRPANILPQSLKHWSPGAIGEALTLLAHRMIGEGHQVSGNDGDPL